MDSVKIINIASIVCFICAAILLIVAISIFIIFDIRGIINSLRGKKVEMQIKEIREKYSKSSSVRYEINRININNINKEDKNKTDKIIKTGMEKTDEIMSDNKTKEVMPRKNQEEYSNMETDILSNNTEVLDNGTEVLGQETAVLYFESANTDELTKENIESGTVLLKEEKVNIDTSFKIIKNIISVNCEEII